MLQVVVPAEVPSYSEMERLSTGASVAVTGVIVESPGKGQRFEVKASEVRKKATYCTRGAMFFSHTPVCFVLCLSTPLRWLRRTPCRTLSYTLMLCLCARESDGRGGGGFFQCAVRYALIDRLMDHIFFFSTKGLRWLVFSEEKVWLVFWCGIFFFRGVGVGAGAGALQYSKCRVS